MARGTKDNGKRKTGLRMFLKSIKKVLETGENLVGKNIKYLVGKLKMEKEQFWHYWDRKIKNKRVEQIEQV